MMDGKGFKEQAREIASDPVKWREAMESARDQIIKMKAQRDTMRRGGGGGGASSGYGSSGSVDSESSGGSAGSDSRYDDILMQQILCHK